MKSFKGKSKSSLYSGQLNCSKMFKSAIFNKKTAELGFEA